MSKRVFRSLLIAIISWAVLFSILPVYADEAAGEGTRTLLKSSDSGKCGANAFWSFSGSTLEIYGSGATYTWAYQESDYLPPWADYMERIRTVKIGEGITQLSQQAFAECSNMQVLYIPASMKKLGLALFMLDGPSGTLKVYYAGTRSEWNALLGRSDDPFTYVKYSVTYTGSAVVPGWVKDGSRWWYRRSDGSYPANVWQKIDGKRYHFDAGGYMQTGWQRIGGKWYYLGTDGAMQTGWQRVSGKWYYFGGDGVMRTGWQKIGGKWYYLGTDGAMRAGWQKISGKWYYLGTDGAMRTSWQKIGGKWYYLGSDGAMCTGWKKISGKWYYLGTDGAMRTSWQKISGKWYYLGSDGAMRTGWKKIGGVWYYFASSGEMSTGWRKIKGEWYHFRSSGAMDTGWYQEGANWYYLGGDGRMRSDEFDDTHRYFFNEDGVMADLGIDCGTKTVSSITVNEYDGGDHRHYSHTVSASTAKKIARILSRAEGSDSGFLRTAREMNDYYYYSMKIRYTDGTAETVWLFPYTDYEQYFYCDGTMYFDYGSGSEIRLNRGFADQLEDLCTE